MKQIKSRMPKGCQYKERLFYFKHSDSGRIARAVCEMCKSECTPGLKDPLLTIPDHMKPNFAIAVRLEALPAEVCPVRVLISCVMQKPA